MRTEKGDGGRAAVATRHGEAPEEKFGRGEVYAARENRRTE